MTHDVRRESEKREILSSSSWIPRIPKKPPDLDKSQCSNFGGGTEKTFLTDLDKGKQKMIHAEGPKVRMKVDEGKPKSDRPVLSWASLFQRTRCEEDWRFSNELSEKIKKIEENAKGRVKITDKDLMEARSNCKLAMYGKFFGRTSPLELVRNLMPKIWKLKSSCQIVDLSAGFFVFKFENEKDYWNTFGGGPWFLRGQALSLIPWKDSFQPLTEFISSVGATPGVTIRVFESKYSTTNCCWMGRPIKIDEYTKLGARGKFARICILLDIMKPLEQGIWIDSKDDNFFQTVAYENIPNLCYVCGKVGHKENVCS
ncbi:hypothetical protein Cni_G28896 [Canna indica]|uniref:CCHC-type domain-containing protein n=1 Tax=Canna indica TaxID=4628 RepID=A0AAQ3L485_9LILI|nr:hypothetical protein Cni_G28896 [Canna indica]